MGLREKGNAGAKEDISKIYENEKHRHGNNKFGKTLNVK